MQVKCFHDFELFDGVSQCEYEANCFAADYLLEDEDVLEKLNANMSFFQAASELQVPPEQIPDDETQRSPNCRFTDHCQQ